VLAFKAISDLQYHIYCMHSEKPANVFASLRICIKVRSISLISTQTSHDIKISGVWRVIFIIVSSTIYTQSIASLDLSLFV